MSRSTQETLNQRLKSSETSTSSSADNVSRFFYTLSKLTSKCLCKDTLLLSMTRAHTHFLSASNELTLVSPLAISPQLFHSKHSSSANPILIHALPHTFFPVSTPNSILSSCLTLRILTCCLSILVWFTEPVNKLVPATLLLWAL